MMKSFDFSRRQKFVSDPGDNQDDHNCMPESNREKDFWETNFTVGCSIF